MSPCSALSAGCERCRGALTQRCGAGYMAVTRTGSRQATASSNFAVKVSLTSQAPVIRSYLMAKLCEHQVQSQGAQVVTYRTLYGRLDMASDN